MSTIDIEEQFSKLRTRHWKKKRVEWCWRLQHDRSIYFGSFGNRSDVKGRGAECLREVCDLADKMGLDITLWTQPVRLHSYYESFGFVFEHKTDDGPAWFRRKAVRQAVAA
jgi:hypothetical protein